VPHGGAAAWWRPHAPVRARACVPGAAWYREQRDAADLPIPMTHMRRYAARSGWWRTVNESAAILRRCMLLGTALHAIVRSLAARAGGGCGRAGAPARTTSSRTSPGASLAQPQRCAP